MIASCPDVLAPAVGAAVEMASFPKAVLAHPVSEIVQCTSPAACSYSSLAVRMCASAYPWACLTIFGRDVVPLVKYRIIGSSTSVPTGGTSHWTESCNGRHFSFLCCALSTVLREPVWVQQYTGHGKSLHRSTRSTLTTTTLAPARSTRAVTSEEGHCTDVGTGTTPRRMHARTTPDNPSPATPIHIAKLHNIMFECLCSILNHDDVFE